MSEQKGNAKLLKNVQLQTFETKSLFLEWLTSQGLEDITCQRFKQHEIDGLTLSLLCEEDLQEMGIESIGDRKRLMFLIQIWCADLYKSITLFESDQNLTLGNFQASEKSNIICPERLVNATVNEITKSIKIIRKLRMRSVPSYNQPNNSDNYVSVSNVSVKIKYLKVSMSILYALISLMITSFMIVLTQERLPDTSKFLPLPDILLENIPYAAWALSVSELIIFLLIIIWSTILIFHTHRSILVRRFCSLVGTIYLLRSVSMFITSMSVPGFHSAHKCKPIVLSSFKQKLIQAFHICIGMGMRIQGVNTCGDYMFSGHTSMITLLNLFIIEYTPRSFYPLHFVTSFLNLFGVFLVLASHEHYSIDAFIALYISSRLFVYYHWLANTHFLTTKTKERLKLWFPLFYFFEGDTRTPINNEYCSKPNWVSAKARDKCQSCEVACLSKYTAS